MVDIRRWWRLPWIPGASPGPWCETIRVESSRAEPCLSPAAGYGQILSFRTGPIGALVLQRLCCANPPAHLWDPGAAAYPGSAAISSMVCIAAQRSASLPILRQYRPTAAGFDPKPTVGHWRIGEPDAGLFRRNPCESPAWYGTARHGTARPARARKRLALHRLIDRQEKPKPIRRMPCGTVRYLYEHSYVPNTVSHVLQDLRGNLSRPTVCRAFVVGADADGYGSR